jgi:hypothetical protein
VARRHGAPFAVTEAMLDQTLLRGGKGLQAAELDEEDHPVAGQLMGSHPADIAAGARLLLGLGYDVIDVNLACPVKKIRRNARGGHLLAEPDEAIAILDAVRQAVGDARPCTVKLRRGTDESAAAEGNFHRILAAAIELGYAGAVIHGRTVEQKYIGPSRWPSCAAWWSSTATARGRALPSAVGRHDGRGHLPHAARDGRARERRARRHRQPVDLPPGRALMAGARPAAERAPTLASSAVLLETELSVAHLDEGTRGR